ncbi:hypothetical protein ACFYY8_15145 [Streptosporangium sp. NPDC001559]|uniref:hypothetical protein n=1 Tax=Streptosporangium sp. NPDC001559 TaxID=3366187 RepID=UPI0036F0BA84
MAELRLQAGSEQILARWWESAKPKEGDQQLVCEVLRTIADGTWRDRWYPPEDLANDQPVLPVRAFRPRDSLVILVRFWPAEDPPEFELINIFDEDDFPDED